MTQLLRALADAPVFAPCNPEASSQAFASDLRKMTPGLQRYARTLTRTAASAEDLLQDTLERAWRNRDRYDPLRDLRPWLMVIMRNRYYDVVAANRATVQDVAGKHAGQLAILPTQLLGLEVAELLRAIDALPKMYRDAVDAILLQKLSYRVGAALFNCPVPTLKSRVQRARRMLKEATCGETRGRSRTGRPAPTTGIGKARSTAFANFS